VKMSPGSQGLSNHMPLWHERDISHSSVERVIFPDAFLALDFITDRFARIIDGLIVYPDNMKKNLDSMHGLIFSGKVLLMLVESGLQRKDAYKIVQRNAMKTWESGEDLKALLKKDREVSKNLKDEQIEKAFSFNEMFNNIDFIFRRVFE
jgi:adenylosuccinate lyase